MRTWHPWNEFTQEETTICADAGQKVIDVAHDVESTNSYFILKAVQTNQLLI